MPYTFECGICNSSYRLDDTQITPSGVKVTCPKCLNFFFLRQGSSATEKPVIEHVVSDGEYQVQGEATDPIPKPTQNDDLTSPLPKPSSTPLKSDPIPQPSPKQEREETGNQIPKEKEPSPSPALETPMKKMTIDSGKKKISAHELSDYPDEEEGRSKWDQYVILVALILIVLSGLLLLNYQRILDIPFLGTSRQFKIESDIKEKSTPPTGTEEDAVLEKPRYGFPIIDEKGNFVQEKKRSPKH